MKIAYYLTQLRYREELWLNANYDKIDKRVDMSVVC